MERTTNRESNSSSGKGLETSWHRQQRTATLWYLRIASNSRPATRSRCCCSETHGKGQSESEEAVALRRGRARVDGGRFQQESHIAGGRGVRICCQERKEQEKG